VWCVYVRCATGVAGKVHVITWGEFLGGEDGELGKAIVTRRSGGSNRQPTMLGTCQCTEVRRRGPKKEVAIQKPSKRSTSSSIPPGKVLTQVHAHGEIEVEQGSPLLKYSEVHWYLRGEETGVSPWKRRDEIPRLRREYMMHEASSSRCIMHTCTKEG
jgi:hypothetical protein